MKNIAIYGTGKNAEIVYNFLADLAGEGSVSFFIKTNAEKEEKFHDLRVVGIDNLIKDEIKNTFVIIAIRYRKVVIDIKQKLLRMYFAPEQIIEVNSFLLDNLTVHLKEDVLAPNYCLSCNHKVGAFLPGGEKNSGLFNRYYVIGGGYRENAICPLCGAIDRVRWQQYVLKKYTNILNDRCNVLHIAPEDSIYRLLRQNILCDYYAGDIELGKTNHKVDLTNIQFRDNFFDYIIANHVLEHIKDIKLAFKEIKRVLKKDGKLIISFPICTELCTKEEKEDLNEEERLEQFGQKDHVRLFGYDYKIYIEKYGFNVKVLSPKNILEGTDIKKYGFIEDDVILICSRK